PPYILMPHSASGIYAEFYASTYPQEVSALILLDSTTTVLNEKMPEKMPWYMRAAYNLGKVQQAVGMTRLAYLLVPETKLPINGYTKQEIDDYRLFTYHVLNDTIIEQSMLMLESISAVNKIPFPESIPVLKILSQDTMDRMSKKDAEAGMDYHNKHLARLGSHAVYKVLGGTHFLYQTHASEIVAIAEAFLQGELR
ncbi:MAG TPA: alpha/beta hydrolase, partial [Bacillota bacterium]|nr:alpha/beta hydrolase [Bacillota bacterium]